MAEADTWPSINRHGLLSTTGLLDLFEVTGTERRRLESQLRPESVAITHPKYGRAVIRDQKPMRESALLTCLTDMTPRKWYETLNRRVFFWLTRERLLTLLAAKAYRGKAHCVLTVDTAQLAARYKNKITLSPINSGSTIYKPVARGSRTFLALDEYPFESRRKAKGVANAIAELAVDYAISDIGELVLEVHQMRGADVEATLFER